MAGFSSEYAAIGRVGVVVLFEGGGGITTNWWHQRFRTAPASDAHVGDGPARYQRTPGTTTRGLAPFTESSCESPFSSAIDGRSGDQWKVPSAVTSPDPSVIKRIYPNHHFSWPGCRGEDMTYNQIVLLCYFKCVMSVL